MIVNDNEIQRSQLSLFLSYDLDTSAKNSRNLLVVVKQKNLLHQKRECLTIVEWNTISVWSRIKLSFSGCLRKKTIKAFLARRIGEWSSIIGEDHALRVKFEKQCAKLNRKINIEQLPGWQWTLQVDFQYKDDDEIKQLKQIFPFNRLTKYDTIYRKMAAVRDCWVKYNRKVTFNLYDVFKERVYCGKGFNWNKSGTFLSDDEKGGNRACQVYLSDLDQGSLMTRLLKQTEDAAYNRGYDDGYRNGYSKGKAYGYQQGINVS